MMTVVVMINAAMMMEHVSVRLDIQHLIATPVILDIMYQLQQMMKIHAHVSNLKLHYMS